MEPTTLRIPGTFHRRRQPLAAAAFLAVTVLALACLAAPARAGTFTWWATGSAGVAGGTGSWDTTNAYWTSNGTSWTNWVNANNDVAVFGGATAGTVTLSTGITANGLTFATDGYLITSGTVTLAGSSPTITVNSTLTGTISSVLAGSAGLTKAGDGLLRLAGANTYSGGTVLRSGTIVAASASAVSSSGTVTINDASTGSSNTSLLIDASGGSITVPRVITVANQGTGTVTIGSFAQGAGTTAGFSGAITLQQRDVTLFGASGGDRTQFSGGISGTGNVTITTAGGSRIIFGSTNNTYSGSTTITAGSRLQLGANSGATVNMLPDGSTVTVSGTLQLAKGGGSEAIDALLGSGTAEAIAGADTLIVGSAGGSGTFAGVLRTNGGTLAITKSGTGTQVLTGNNSYGAGTTLSQGTLVAANSNALGTSGTVTINDASTGSNNTSLLIDASGGSVTIGRAITVANQGTGTVTIGSSAQGAGTTAGFSGAIVLQQRDVTLVGASGGDRTQFTGGVSGTGNVTFTTTGSGRIILNTIDNTYSGSTTITANSRLQLGAGNGATVNMLPDGSTVTVTGTLQLAKGGGSETIDALLGNGTVESFSGADTLVVGSAGGSGTFTGVIRQNGGSLAFTKSGAGTQVLSGGNTYAGVTTISGGTLQIGNGSTAGTLGSGTVSIASGATLAFNRSDSYGGTVSNAITGNGAVSVNAGTLTLGGANTFSGGLTLGAATLSVSSSSVLGSGTVSVTAVSTLSVSGAAATFDNAFAIGSFAGNWTLSTPNNSSTVLNGTLSGGGPSTVLFFLGGATGQNTGALTLNGTNTFAGTINVQRGPLILGNSSAAGSAKILLDSNSAPSGALQLGNFAIANTLELKSGASVGVAGSDAATISGPVTSTAGTTFIKVGTGRLTLTGTNTYTGATQINAGTLEIGGAGVLGNGSYSPTITNSSSFVFSSSATQTLSGVISGTGSITKSGAGTLTLTASNTYTGTTSITAGTLRIGNNAALGSGTVAFDGGTLSSNGATARSIANPIVIGGNVTLGDATNSGTLTFTGGMNLGGTTRQITTPSNVTIASAVSGAGGLTKAGAGILTLSDVQAFTGATRIDAGTLAIGGTNTLASASEIYVAAGAVLDATAAGLTVVGGQTLGGYGTVNGNVAIAGGAIVSPGGSIGTLTNAGTETWGAAGRYLFEITNANGTSPGTDWDLLNVNALAITATSGAGNQFVIDVQSLANGTDQTAGPMSGANWDSGTSYQWKFLVATSTTFSAANFDTSWFTVTTSTATFQNSTNGSFYVARGGAGGLGGTTNANELYVVYAAVPEPGTFALAGIGLAALGWAASRRRRS